jgi:hypothetical protein
LTFFSNRPIIRYGLPSIRTVFPNGYSFLNKSSCTSLPSNTTFLLNCTSSSFMFRPSSSVNALFSINSEFPPRIMISGLVFSFPKDILVKLNLLFEPTPSPILMSFCRRSASSKVIFFYFASLPH